MPLSRSRTSSRRRRARLHEPERPYGILELGNRHTLTLSGSATVAQYQAALRSITYQNTSDNPNTTSRAVNFTVNDGSTNSNTVARTITLTASNDAPTQTLPATYGTNEDTSLALTGLQVDDPDIAAGTLTVTLSVPTGTLTATSGSGVTASGSGSGTLTLSGTKANLNAYSRRFASEYVPFADHNGTVTLTMTTSDGSLTATGTSTITIAAVLPTFQASPPRPRGHARSLRRSSRLREFRCRRLAHQWCRRKPR